MCKFRRHSSEHFCPGKVLNVPWKCVFSGSLVAGPANWNQHRFFNAQRVGFFGFSAIVYWTGLECTYKNLWSCEHAGMCCCIKIKRCKCPSAYYSNSTATFHCLLEGDLVFKLNPGPSGRPIPIIMSVRDEPGQTHNNGHNSKNLSCVQPAKFRPTNMSQSLLSFCLMNTRSVRNKAAVLMDYM